MKQNFNLLMLGNNFKNNSLMLLNKENLYTTTSLVSHSNLNITSSENQNKSFNSYNKSNIFKTYVFVYDVFSRDNFIKFLMENLYINSSYSILIKLGFDGNSVFYMLDHQMGITLKNTHNIDFYEDIYDIILLKINDLLLKYDIDHLPNTITIYYKLINVPSF